MINIIPAIDIIDSKCVRLSQGDYGRKIIYNENPLEVAKLYEDIGIRNLHLVDLDGAKAGHIVNHKVLENIASKTNLIIDFGGGLKSSSDLKIAFESGASMITGGSIAVKNKDEFTKWIKEYGSDKIILGADTKDKKIAISGWLEIHEISIFELIEGYIKEGIKKVISTDISRDGMLTGPSFELYKELIEQFAEIELIASGGISSMDDIYKLDEMKIPAVIVGKAIYENRITLSDLKDFNK
jgi:phosphoribosylformimino-5-aminoimidazole carboxamide ribotide isomerase